MSKDIFDVTDESTQSATSEFFEQVEDLEALLERQCDKYEHAGVVIVALTNTLCMQLQGMIMANALNREEMIAQIKSDIDTFMDHFQDMGEQSNTVPVALSTSKKLN